MDRGEDPVVAAVAALAALDDAQFRSAVAQAAQGRPGLAALAAAAVQAQAPAAQAPVVAGPVLAGPPPAPGLPGAVPDVGFTPGGVPTFDSVREKIEGRVAVALGSEELDAQTPEGQSVQEQFEARSSAARDRLDQIRRAMRGGAVG